MIRPLLAMLCVVLTGCVGEVSETGAATEAPTPGVPTVRVTGWREVSAGLPPTASVRSMAHFNGTVYAVAGAEGATELFALDEGQDLWRQLDSKTELGINDSSERVQSVVRIDLAIYVTTANTAAGTGGVYRLELGADRFASVPAPAQAASALLKKGSTLLLALGGKAPGLYASTDRGATWQLRADPSRAPFLAHPIRSLVSSPSAQRIFATGEVTSGFGGLYASDDEGATWTPSPLRGEVRAITAGGAVALVDLTVDGPQRSDNYGNTWHPVSALANEARTFLIVGDRAFAGTAAGVRASADTGQTWTDASEGLPSVEVQGLYLAGNALYSSTALQVFVASVSDAT